MRRVNGLQTGYAKASTRWLLPFFVLGALAPALLHEDAAHSQQAMDVPIPQAEQVAIMRFTYGKDGEASEQERLETGNALITLVGLGLASQGVATVERDDNILNNAAREFRLNQEGYLEPSSAAQVGKRLGAKWVLTGFVEQLDVLQGRSHAKIRAKLVNVVTGSPLPLKTVIVGDAPPPAPEKKKTPFLKELLGGLGQVGAALVAPSAVRSLQRGGGGREEAQLRRSPLYQTVMRAAFQMGEEIATSIPTVRGKILAVEEDGQLLAAVGVQSGIKVGRRFVIFDLIPIKNKQGVIAGYRRKELFEAEASQVEGDTSTLTVKGRLPGVPADVMVKEEMYARPRPLTRPEWEGLLNKEKEEADRTAGAAS